MSYLADRYAHFIVHSMLRLEDGEKLTLHANEETLEAAHRIAHEAAETTGVSVQLVYIEKGKVESVDEIAPSYREKEARGLAMLNLTSFTPSTYSEEAELDAVTLQQHRLLADPIFLDRRIGIPYAVAYLPTAQWAEFVYGPGATVDQLYLDLSDFLGLEMAEEVTASYERTLSQRCKLLNGMGIDSLHFESPTVQLDVKLATGARIGSSAMRLSNGRMFYPTLPVEDIIFPLDYRSGSGKIRSSYPFRLFDRTVEDVEIEIRDGRITSFSSDVPSLVSKYMNIDRLSASLGEAIICESLTSPSLFTKSFGLPLLDRMRSSALTFGGVTPELITLTDENLLDENGLNTGFARLEIPFGDRNLSVSAKLKDGSERLIFEDGLFDLEV